MSRYSVSGSTHPSCCDVEISTSKTFDNIAVTLGVQEVLTAIDDILSDYDALTEEQFQKFLDIAGEIQSIAVLRDAEKICMNCDDPRACVNCETFAKIHGNF